MLPENQTVVFYTPLKGNDVLVRTGTIGEGSCLFHSVLLAHSSEYQALSHDRRREFVQKLRSSMSRGVSKGDWERLGDGMVSRVPFQEKMREMMGEIYTTVPFGGDGLSSLGHSARKVLSEILVDSRARKICRLISDLVPYEEGFEQTIFPNTAKGCENDTGVGRWGKIMKQETFKYMATRPELQGVPDDKLVSLKNGVFVLVNTMVKEAEHSVYKKYKSTLKDTAEDVDQQLIQLVSERFDRDIYFVDGNTRMPYKNDFSCTDNIKGRRAIIILWVDSVHFEVIGRLLPGNRVQRDFGPDDPLIKKLRTFLCEPGKVASKYPELASYLPKEYASRSDHEETGLYQIPSPSSSESSGNDEW